jgi:hypothetical protein
MPKKHSSERYSPTKEQYEMRKKLSINKFVMKDLIDVVESSEFDKNNQHYWDHIIDNQVIDESFLRKYGDYITLTQWLKALKWNEFSEEFLIEFLDDVLQETRGNYELYNIWSSIQTNKRVLSEDFLIRYEFLFLKYLNNLISNHKLSEEFLDRYIEPLKDIPDILYRYQTLSEEFMERHLDLTYENWFEAQRFQILSEPFIEKHKDVVDWVTLAAHQDLSESFIVKHQDKLLIDYIIMNQKLSENFLLNNLEDIDIDFLSFNKHISKELIEKVKFMKELQL